MTIFGHSKVLYHNLSKLIEKNSIYSATEVGYTVVAYTHFGTPCTNTKVRIVSSDHCQAIKKGSLVIV